MIDFNELICELRCLADNVAMIMCVLDNPETITQSTAVDALYSIRKHIERIADGLEGA